MAMKSEKIRKLVTMAMLAALSIVLVYVVHFPIFPAAPFLEYDPADIPILIGTFAYGPVAGIILTVVVSVIQGMTVSASSGFMGIAMHIFATSILVLVFVVLGGLGNMLGSIIAAAALTILPEALREFSDYRMLVYAIVLILVMLATNSPFLSVRLQRLKALVRREKTNPGKEGEAA